MELNSRSVHEVLKKKGVESLHHANTVQTACLFLLHGRLLSRGAVEDRGLVQTPQRSDDLDKRYAIWHDVFLDSIDIHERAKARNIYGPVLFRLRLDVLLDEALPTIWITRKNPTEWKDGEGAEERYFASVAEFAEGYSKGDFGSMFMFRHIGGTLKLRPYLSDIVVDAPEISNDYADLFSHTIGALRSSAWQGGLMDVEFSKRQCAGSCNCSGQYETLLRSARAGDERELTKLFDFSGEA